VYAVNKDGGIGSLVSVDCAIANEGEVQYMTTVDYPDALNMLITDPAWVFTELSST
jgi:hypothetical protein